MNARQGPPRPAEGPSTFSGPAGPNPAEKAVRLMGLLGEPERFRVAAAVALGSRGIDDIVSLSKVPRRAAEREVARLISGGLLERDDAGYRFAAEELKDASRAMAVIQPTEDFDAPTDEVRVLRSFIRDGRLKTIPAVRSKRVVVLDYLSRLFEPGRRYPESAVNESLSLWHEDVATLRRYLVDEGFMQRHNNEYWRTGGTFDVD